MTEVIEHDGISRGYEETTEGFIVGRPDDAGEQYRQTIEYQTYHDMAVFQGRVALCTLATAERGASGPGFPDIGFGD